MTKTEMILSHLQMGYPITSMQAFELYKETRLSSVIFNLRKRGHNIISVKKRYVNEFGRPSKYSEYKLINEPKNS